MTPTRRSGALAVLAAGVVFSFGGLFFRGADPGALAEWYEQHLGISRVPSTYEEPCWEQHAGPTVFAPFALNSDYFETDRAMMLNFRVDDLEALTDALRKAGIAVETRAAWTSEIGRFARLHAPEGNPVELWEPAGPAVS